MRPATNRLAEAIERYAAMHEGESPYQTDIDGLILLRDTTPGLPTHLVHKPTLCAVVQGSKETTVGDATYVYQAGQALVVTVDMPGVSVITAASPSAPYLSIIFELDPGVMADVLEGLDTPPAGDGRQGRGVGVVDLDAVLVDCLLRAVRMLDTPDAIPLLYPALQREVGYWLLTGPHGAAVAASTVSGARGRDVARAVHALRDRYAEAVRVEELAEIAHLSPSAFHRQFKALTSMSPVQYQKQIRLTAARRLMLSEDATAEAAAYEVGYKSASQFSREYARAFGAPPGEDVRALRASVA